MKSALFRGLIPGVLLVVCGTSSPAFGDVHGRIACRTGFPVAEGIDWANFSYINWANQPPSNPPIIADSGDVAFTGTLRGAGVWVVNDKAVGRVDRSGNVSMITRRSDRAPGTPNEVIFFDMYEPVLGPNGRIAVRASLSGPGVDNATNLHGIWSKYQGGVQLEVREGDAVPGAEPSTVVATLQDPLLVASSQSEGWIARSTLGGPSAIPGRTAGTLADAPSGSHLLLRDGDPAPGTGGAVFSSPQTVTTTSGSLAVYSALVGNGVTPANAQGLWFRSVSADRLIARAGDHAPGTSSGVVYTQISGSTWLPAANDYGEVAFNAWLTGPGVDALNNCGVWMHNGQSLQMLIRAGSAVPGAGSGVTFAQPTAFGGSNRSVAIGDDGSVTFLSLIRGTGVTSSNNRALFSIRDGVVSMLARGGAPAPDAPSGVTFNNTSVGEVVRVGPNGHAAIRAKVQGTGITTANDYGIWRSGATGLRLIAREGDVIGNHRLHTITNNAAELQVNALGQVVFRADVVAVGDPYSTRLPAIIACDPAGVPQVAAVDGGTIPLSSGNSAAISNIKMSTAQAINASGEIVFTARMVSQSEPVDEAIFVVTLGEATSCPGDYDRSGQISNNDLFLFLSDWFAGRADFNHSGDVTTQDLFDFLAAWFSGCP